MDRVGTYLLVLGKVRQSRIDYLLSAPRKSELYHLLLLDLVHDRQDPVQEQTKMIRRTVDASPRTEKTKIANRKKDATTWSLIGPLAGG
jgi:hypothetical protein